MYQWAHTQGREKGLMRLRRLPKDFRLSFDLKDGRRAEQAESAAMPISRRKVTLFDAWVWWFEGLSFGDDKIRPLRFVDPSDFFLRNARKRFSQLKIILTRLIGSLADSGKDVWAVNASERRLMFADAWKLHHAFIEKHHPKSSKREKSKHPKETMAYTLCCKALTSRTNTV
jgi:hypothetical protein